MPRWTLTVCRLGSDLASARRGGHKNKEVSGDLPPILDNRTRRRLVPAHRVSDPSMWGLVTWGERHFVDLCFLAVPKPRSPESRRVHEDLACAPLQSLRRNSKPRHGPGRRVCTLRPAPWDGHFRRAVKGLVFHSCCLMCAIVCHVLALVGFTWTSRLGLRVALGVRELPGVHGAPENRSKEEPPPQVVLGIPSIYHRKISFHSFLLKNISMGRILPQLQDLFFSCLFGVSSCLPATANSSDKSTCVFSERKQKLIS